MNNLKKIGILGMALKNQVSGCGEGYDVIYGQITVLNEGYDPNKWKPVSINEKGEVFEIETIDEPLTFERIRKECVAGKTLLISDKGHPRLFLGFSRNGKHVVCDMSNLDYCSGWQEEEIRNWRIGGKWEEN